jgi:uncharacterized protein (DUF1800 family)
MPSPLEGRIGVAHLLRRVGFGPDARTWDSWAALDYDTAVERILAEIDAPPAADPPGFDPYDPGRIQQTWLERMLHAPSGAAERLAFFWHGHFATSDAKIVDPALMWAQYQLFRAKGAGSFRDLVLGVSRDVAMIRWLDGNANRRGHPNENYGRELQELFTLGIGNYTETDIREVSRAFTGWGSRHHTFVFRPEFHDGGEKTVHGRHGPLGGEDVVDILTAQPACSRFIAGKLLRAYSHPHPSDAEVEALAKVFRDSGLDVRATLAHLLRSEGFRDRARLRVLVKGPVQFCVGGLRALGAGRVPPWIHGALDRMGQILFRPPSVKGWTSGKGWLSSGSVVERLRTAQRLATTFPVPGGADVVDVALQGEMPAASSRALEGVGGAQRVALVLGGPEFQLD